MVWRMMNCGNILRGKGEKGKRYRIGVLNVDDGHGSKGRGMLMNDNVGNLKGLASMVE